MTNEHYRRTIYSAEEAKAVLRKNSEMMYAMSKKIAAARTGVADHADAKMLDMTVEEYRNIVG